MTVPGVEPALLILDTRGQEHSLRGKLKRVTDVDHFLWRVYGRLSLLGSQALRPVDLSSKLAHVPTLSCTSVRLGQSSEYFRDEDVDAISKYDLDFILRLAFGIIKGRILEVPRYGVWSFHHDDLDEYRGGPPCFWEICHCDPVTGAVLQRLTERLDAGVLLHRGFFRTALESYVANRDAAFFGSADWPARVCRDIIHGNASYIDGVPSQTNAPIFHNPTNLDMIAFGLRSLRNKLTAAWRTRMLHDVWSVGVVPRPIHTFTSSSTLSGIHWVPAPARHRYLADPFGRQQKDGLTILVEDFDHLVGKGRISTVTSPNGKSFTEPWPVMELPVHVSYPFLLEYDAHLYCVPETSQAREVALFKADHFPDQWTKVAVLVEDFAAVDPTIFKHEGRWWLFCTDLDSGPFSKLYAWYADDLFGSWGPHAANPLKTDVRSSRPAGTPFVHEGGLYRPAQDCTHGYGTAVVINRVLRLTPAEFEEEVVNVVRPAPNSTYSHGLHTLSSAGDFTLVDGKRLVFTPQVFLGRLATYLRRKLWR
jgi:hypothetical protein